MTDLKRLFKIEKKLYEYAQEYGLEHCDIEWDIIPDQKMFEIMAYRIPGNVSNWKYGRDYEKIRTMNEQVRHGLPYEVVINSDPSRAYLMKSNTIGVQMLVMAHVIGHVAFFTMNKYFINTNKSILSVIHNAETRFNEYEKVYGLDELEMTIDAGHALQFHSSPFETETEENKKKRVFEMEKSRALQKTNAKFKDLTDVGIPKQKIGTDIHLYNQKLWRRIKQQTPIEPSTDLLRYIIDHSTVLEDWQMDILETLRKEGQYYWPQMKTKYMNEGFATFWHQKMINRLYKEKVITDSEHAEYNYSNALVKAKHRTMMNPYLIGCRIWEDIVERWDKGRHGDEYEDCLKGKDKENWDTKDMKGHEKMLEIVRTYQDWFFVKDFLTAELVDDLDLYIFVARETPEEYQIVRTKHTAEQVKEQIVKSFAHSHIPKIEITDINFKKAGHLRLKHSHVGADLFMEYTEKTLKHIYDVWGRPVILETYLNKKHVIIECSENESSPGQPLEVKIFDVDDFFGGPKEPGNKMKP